jgi:hypothetical protein
MKKVTDSNVFKVLLKLTFRLSGAILGYPRLGKA